MQTKMLMWRWQGIFETAVENLLKSIFQVMELPIVSDTFAIGIPVDSQNVDWGLFPPQKDGFTVRELQQILEIAKDNFDCDPEQFFFMGNPHLDRAHKDSLYPKALRKAVCSLLQQRDSERERVSFCSFPVQKNDRWLVTVIQLKQQDFDRQYRLKKETHEVHLRRYRIERCFLEALIYRVLKESELELQRPSEGNTSLLANPERAIEDAASSLLKSVELHINQWNRVDLLSFANAIAAERYEGAASEGRLIICQTDHPDIRAKVKLDKPIEIYNYRGVRKLLEVSSSNMALLCDIKSVWGLGMSLNTYQPNREDLFEIRFAEHHTWELIHAENIMLRVKYRQARLPRARFDRQLFGDRLVDLFDLDPSTVDLLTKAVQAAVKQRHGTMLVITPEAERESKRLAAQSTVIEPIMVSQDLIFHLSCIDGAILISPAGIVYSFGVILDGKATTNGCSTRGARYNSAIRYVDGEREREINCLALIVSEDGYVDLYSSL